MKNIISTIALLFLSISLFSQQEKVGINITPDNSTLQVKHEDNSILNILRIQDVNAEDAFVISQDKKALFEEEVTINGALRIGSGQENIFMGTASGSSNSTGSSNVFLGYESGSSNTTGGRNVFNGFESGESNTTGNSNVFLGYMAGKANQSGGFNVFLGSESGFKNTTGYENICLGNYSAGSNTTGYRNVFIGNAAGGNNNTGHGNVFLGHRSGRYNVSGTGSVFIGHEAGLNETSSNRLYIENSDKSKPLIYGEFDNNRLYMHGQVAMGGANATRKWADGYLLSVMGKIMTEEVRVRLNANWPDYVFKKEYVLTPIDELESQIEVLGHLPGIPTAAEVEAEGFDLGEMNRLQMEKIEELTLYIIELEKRTKAADLRNDEIEKRLLALEK